MAVKAGTGCALRRLPVVMAERTLPWAVRFTIAAAVVWDAVATAASRTALRCRLVPLWPAAAVEFRPPVAIAIDAQDRSMPP